MIPDDTIAAISSAVGAAARMIVRVSGERAHELARSLCNGAKLAPGRAERCELRMRGFALPIWVYSFASPHSYTGQDLVEFHIPGNPLLASMLLEELLGRGARSAEAGEFTARAYFSGRIDLTEAEGVAATIGAQSEAELRAARQLLAGELSRRLRPVMDSVAQTLALVEVGIDFSDEQVTFLSPAEIVEQVKQADGLLAGLLEQSARFERLSHEPRAVLVGRPNAGKSTLLNALAGRDRAVVSPAPGTTRDALGADVALPRGLLRLVDVAGLEDEPSSNEIGRQMHEHALREIESADLVILVHDASGAAPRFMPPRAADLVVFSKADLVGAIPVEAGAVAVSAVTGENLAALRHRLDELAFGSAAACSTLALNSRHVRAIEEARLALSRAIDGAAGAGELLAVELREALDALGRVLGSVSPDDLLGRIFAAFCIGK